MFKFLNDWLESLRGLFPRAGGDRKHRQGRRGEKLAVKHLRSAGYEILRTNWRWKRYEIDVVARKDRIIAFVEVKTRADTAFGRPEEFVDRNKQAFLRRAADAFIGKYRLHGFVHRLDVVSVLLPEDGKPAVEHIEDAFPL
jgi:putative endonuclease